MTVMELTEDLSQLDPDMEVIIEDVESGWIIPVEGVDQGSRFRDVYGWRDASPPGDRHAGRYSVAILVVNAP